MDIWVIIVGVGVVVGIVAGVVQVLDYLQNQRERRKGTKQAPATFEAKGPALRQYDLGVVRNLLRDAFTAQDLWRFCQEHPSFQPVLAQLAPDASLEATIDTLTEYCRTHALFDDLLSEVRGFNPRQYERYASQLPKTRDLPSPRIPHNLPPRREFTGREAEKAWVHEALQSRPNVVAIDGIGGIGKTALALEVAHECLDASQAKTAADDAPTFAGVIWVSGKDRSMDLDNLLNTIARTLDQPHLTQQPGGDKAALVTDLLREKPHLVIVDNLEAVAGDELCDFLFQLPEPSRVLITTRQRVLLEARMLSLRDLAETDALDLMRNEGKRLALAPITQADDQDLRQLYQSASGAPLAIKWAVGQIKQQGQSLETVTEALRGAQASIFDSIFAKSWDLLSVAGQRVLMTLTLFTPSASRPEIEAASGMQGDVLTCSLGQLSEMSLVDAIGELRCRRYSLHPLTQAFARAKLDQQPAFKARAVESWIDFFATWRDQPEKPWTIWTILTDYEPDDLRIGDDIENILSAMQYCLWQDAGKWRKAATMLDAYRAFLHMYGYWGERVRICERIMVLAEQENEQKLLGRARGHLGWVLCFRDEYEKGRMHLQAALQTALTEGDRQGQYRALHTLGRLALRQEQYEEAREYFTQAREIAEVYFSSDLFAVLYHLGLTAYEQGRYEEAVRYLDEVWSQAQQNSHKRAQVRSGYYLGELKHREGNDLEAGRLFESGLAIAECHSDNVATANYRLGLAKLKMETGDLVAAQQSLQIALDLYQHLGMRKECDGTARLIAKLQAMIAAGSEGKKLRFEDRGSVY